MMDKDTGRPRGFGFVTFDGEAAVDATLSGPLQILGKPIEVKRAQPRGNMRDEEGGDKKFGGRGNKFNNRQDGNAGFDGAQNQMQQGGGGGNSGMSPAMMAQYWQRMQQYFQQMQQQLAAQQGGGMPNPMGGMAGPMGPGMPSGMNPAMMQQMMGAGMNRNTGSPQGGMNPAMMQQMQQMQQMQMQQQQGGGYGGQQGMMGGGPAGGPRPAYNAQEQLAFEQQKYEQQQARRMQQQAGYGGQGGPTSWEGMYDDIPQPSIPSGPGSAGRGGFGHGGGRGGAGGHQRGQRQGSSQPPSGPSNAPANAPTGPKNAGKPGANYRGGGRNTNNFRHNPYGGHGRG
jgi:RNA-binding protein Musashi